MLAAIRTTIRSRRAWALTGSAMISRRRRRRMRGPPGAPRMVSRTSYHAAVKRPVGNAVQPLDGFQVIEAYRGRIASGACGPQVGVGGIDQHGELDLGCRDGADVGALVGERLESPGRHARMTAHADADSGDLHDI